MANIFLTVHIITGLSTGGAEMMLYQILSKMNRERFSPVVISLIDRGTLGDRIADLGIPVHTLGMKPGKPTIGSIWKLIHQIHQIQPDIIQGWMYHGNFAAQVASAFTLKSAPVLWNIRQSLYSLSYEKVGTSAIIKLLAKLSRFPTKILYNSQVSATQHEQLGYEINKTFVIPNGFNTEIYIQSAAERSSIRKELGLKNEAFLIGRIGRYHFMKDHANFLGAAATLLKNYPNVHFVLAGTEIDWKNQNLCKIIDELGIAECIHLLGERQDIHRLTAALDIACSSSSHGEAFPNVIGEAMSCGVPCVVTDVGDSAGIVGDTGKVVPSGDSQALANALQELIDLGHKGREALGKAARVRIKEFFSLDSVVLQYETLYESLLAKKIQIKG